jgi:hypothetical protein
MKVAVLADDDGEIVAVAYCRMSLTGEPGTYTDADIRGEMRRSDLDSYRGRVTSKDSAEQDAMVESVTMELAEDLLRMSLDEIREGMLLDRSGTAPRLTRKPAPR